MSRRSRKPTGNSSKKTGALMGRSGKLAGRPLAIESLEARVVLSSNSIGGMRGIVSVDSNNNGTVEAGEPVPGAEVRIYLDNGDNAFNAATDTLQETLATDTFLNFTYIGSHPLKNICFVDGHSSPSRHISNRPDLTFTKRKQTHPYCHSQGHILKIKCSRK